MNNEEALPAAFVALLREIAGDAAEQVLAGCTGDRCPAFRANTLKAGRRALCRELAQAGIVYRPHPLSDWSFTTTAEGEARLKASAPYAAGWVYSQGLASQLPAILLPLSSGVRVLDACAAPGGKTTLLAMRLGNGGAGITACDRAPGRFAQLLHTLRLLGAHRVQALRCDMRRPPPAIAAERWDRVLVDAPCSGSGTVRLDRPATWQRLSFDYEGYVASRVRIQTALVERAAALLAPGGLLLYSTCSLDPRENEGVVRHLLHLRAPLELLDLSRWAKPFGASAGPGLRRFRDQEYGEFAAACLRLWPCREHEGFFVALLRRRR
ncbi:MAG: RsmB/NOP family class I SAM-dependent RNA methyltransferase [Planctomycetota bacterium]|nr:RsmB/NOP family class I SAM-dependent RNA methyltransferase [Planctomycetota bacterium]